jgi:hypothetical protein
MNPKGLTHIRVGFVPPPIAGAGGPRPILRRAPAIVLTKDMEACFFLVPHFEENFNFVPAAVQPIDKKSETFEKDLAVVKRCAKVLADPMAALKSKDANERVRAAGILVARYRSVQPGQTKLESIPAAESKLILQTLAEADFNKQPGMDGIGAQNAFIRLGLTDKDGWMPTGFQNFQTEFPAAAKKWLAEHADTYRIQRYVADKKE